MSSLNLNQGWYDFLTQTDIAKKAGTALTPDQEAILALFPNGPFWIRRGGPRDWGVCPLSPTAVIEGYEKREDPTRVQYCYRTLVRPRIRLSDELPSFEACASAYLRMRERETEQAVTDKTILL